MADHECRYFRRVDGVLLCDQCGKTSPRVDQMMDAERRKGLRPPVEVEEKRLHEEIEDKAMGMTWPPPKVRRPGRPRK